MESRTTNDLEGWHFHQVEKFVHRDLALTAFWQSTKGVCHGRNYSRSTRIRG